MFSSNASAVSGDVNYIEDVFSTYLRAGTNTTANVNNGIDLSTKGGMVWFKARNQTGNNTVYDTVRGAGKYLYANLTNAENTNLPGYDLTAFNSNGYTLGTPEIPGVNDSPYLNVAWTFRKQEKFFDVVTYTGNGSASRAIDHNLGSVPGCIIVKCTSTATNWPVYHRGLNGGVNPEQYAAYLNLTNDGTGGGRWANTAPTSTQFYVNNDGTVNTNGATYVAYIFAHDAGGFGLTGTDNVISCGSYTSTGNNDINLGYEPQFIIEKRASGVSDWYIWDTMRGMSQTNLQELEANTSAAEVSFAGGYVKPTATGYNNTYWSAGETIIYIAIRRGPMKVPTDATKVFSPNASSASQGTKITTNFPVDMQWLFYRAGGFSVRVDDRLRGVNTTTTAGTISTPYLQTASTSAETSYTGDTLGWDNTGFQMPNGWAENAMSFNNFQRAPSFFDEVCYKGNDAFNRAIPHNLGAVPELVITKVRSTTANWAVYSAATGLGYPMALNTTAAAGANPYVWGTTAPTSTNFYIGDDTRTNGGGFTYVSYLFATCPGVSKVGSYTGTGTTKQVDCGFAAGARFVLIKRTDSTGDWYVWDSARGIVSGNDPYLLLNSTAAEVTSTDYVDTYAAGFELSSTAPAALNASGGTYIFLAIA